MHEIINFENNIIPCWESQKTFSRSDFIIGLWISEYFSKWNVLGRRRTSLTAGETIFIPPKQIKEQVAVIYWIPPVLEF